MKTFQDNPPIKLFEKINQSHELFKLANEECSPKIQYKFENIDISGD
jgi:hypothetical protein